MFSVVIPLYNKQNSVVWTLQSALNQTYSNFELLIIDDGSTDKSLDKIAEFSDPRIRIIQKENEGVSSARNLGITKAKYPFIAFLDADDYWEEDYLSEQSKLINDFPRAVMWGCGWGTITKNRKYNGVQGDLPDGFRGHIDDYFGRKSKANLFWTSAVVIHAEVFNKIGYFDSRIRYGEDLDMWFRIILHFPIAYYNKSLAYYNLDSENRAMKSIRPELTFCLPYYIEKFASENLKNPKFVHYFHSFCAGFLLPYYFLSGKKAHKKVKCVIKKLDFSKIKRKYFLLYRTPYLIGLAAYFMLHIKNNLYLMVTYLKKVKTLFQ